MARSEHNIIEDPTIRETRYGSTMVDLAPEGYAGWVVERRNPNWGTREEGVRWYVSHDCPPKRVK